MGVPSGFELTATTRPYYRSTYVFLTAEERDLNIASLDDPALKRLQIGVHVIGDDYTNPPPLHALGRRNIVHNVAGYSIFGDYSQPNPPARLVEAVAKAEVDVAIVWGPFAGFFAQHQAIPLRLTPVLPEIDEPLLPLVFDIAMGVRRGEEGFREELEQVLDRREAEIDGIEPRPCYWHQSGYRTKLKVCKTSIRGFRRSPCQCSKFATHRVGGRYNNMRDLRRCGSILPLPRAGEHARCVRARGWLLVPTHPQTLAN